MKKIAVWKVIGLSVITLGVYPIVWFALRRNELVKNYGQRVPHWLWLVIPIIVSTVLVLPFIIVLVLIEPDPVKFYNLSLIGSLALILIPLAFAIWWIAYFGKAVANVTGGRVPNYWTMLWFIFWGPIVTVVHQHYFNRMTDEKSSKETKVGPSTGFIITSVIALAVSVTLTVISVLQLPAQIEKDQNDMRKSAELLDKSNQLLERYDNCIGQLEQEFPDEELAPEDEGRYQAAYNVCEDIRIEQNGAAEEYDKLNP